MKRLSLSSACQIAAVIFCTAFTNVASAQTINNGGFEDGLPAGSPPAVWTVTGSFYHWTDQNKAHGGSQYAYFGVSANGSTPLVNGSGSIEQTISIPSSVSLTLSFWL